MFLSLDIGVAYFGSQYTSFTMEYTLLPSFNVLIFCQFEPQVFLFQFLFIHVLINCNLYTWQLLHTWPVEKGENFPFQKGKKEILKNSPKYKSIVYKKLLIGLKLFLKSISRLFWYIILFLLNIIRPSLCS